MRKRVTARHNSYSNWPFNLFYVHPKRMRYQRSIKHTTHTHRRQQQKTIEIHCVILHWHSVCPCVFSFSIQIALLGTTDQPTEFQCMVGQVFKVLERQQPKQSQKLTKKIANINLGLVNVYADELLFFGRQNKKSKPIFFLGFQRTHLIWMPPNFSSFSPFRCSWVCRLFFSLFSHHRVINSLSRFCGALSALSLTRSLSSLVWHWILWIVSF